MDSLEAVFIDEQRQRATVPVTVQIEGRVAFRQTPQVVDSAETQAVELEITNLLKTPIRIMTVRALNSAYTIPESVADPIAAGRTFKLAISHKPEKTFQDAPITITFAETVIGSSPTVTIPLRLKPPPPAPAGPPVTREEIERFLKSAPPKNRP